MQHIRNRIELLTRPRLLVRAARFALDDYRREIHLRRVLRQDTPPPSYGTVARLLQIEEEMDAGRKAGNAAYSPARHVEVLAAVMHEARLLASRDGMSLQPVSRVVPSLVR